MLGSAQWALLSGFSKWCRSGEWDSGGHLRLRGDICVKRDIPNTYDHRIHLHAHCSGVLADLSRKHGEHLSVHARSGLAFLYTCDRLVFHAQNQGGKTSFYDGQDDYRGDGETCGRTYDGICDGSHLHSDHLYTQARDATIQTLFDSGILQARYKVCHIYDSDGTQTTLLMALKLQSKAQSLPPQLQKKILKFFVWVLFQWQVFLNPGVICGLVREQSSQNKKRLLDHLAFDQLHDMYALGSIYHQCSGA